MAAGRLIYHSVARIKRDSGLHHLTTFWHSVLLRVWVITHAAMKDAGIDIDTWAAALRSDSHHPTQLFSEIASCRHILADKLTGWRLSASSSGFSDCGPVTSAVPVRTL
jgi:hypothetical protein